MEKFLTFIREHVRKIVGGLPWNKMAANTQKDASINPEVIAAIMAWIVDTRLYLFYDRELQHFGMEPRSCMMERVLDVLELPESCLDDMWKDLIYLIVAYRNSGDAALQDKAREAVWLLSDIVDNHRRYPFFTKEKIDMEIESIQHCEDSFPAQLRKKVAMQDAYLNLRPEDLIVCLGDADAESRRILETCAWKGTIGYEISDIDEIETGGGFDDESRIEYCEHIYAMLIAPFTVWLAKTGYKPDDAFLKKTLLRCQVLYDKMSKITSRGGKQRGRTTL